MFLLRKKAKGHTYCYLATKKRVGKASKTIIVRKLGEESDLEASDPGLRKTMAEIERFNSESEENKACVLKELNPDRKCTDRTFRIGQLAVFAAMKEYGMSQDMRGRIEKTREKYDCTRIASDLIAERIIDPASKVRSYERIIENPLYGAKYSLQDTYKSLAKLAEYIDSIQDAMARRHPIREDSVVYYDTTNFYFEIERADEEGGLRQYGISKEHRPNPIVQMGLFTDLNGHPIWCNVNPGNTAECLTVLPSAALMSKAGISNYIYCADAGIGSGRIKIHNNCAARRYVVAQSLKKLDETTEKWALSDDGWNLTTAKKTISGLKRSDCPKDGFLWKETVRKLVVTLKDEKGKTGKTEIAERIIVTYSDSSFRWETHKLENKIKRAAASLRTSRETNPNSTSTILTSVAVDADAEVLDDVSIVTEIDQKKVDKEAKYNGFYAVATNLQKDVKATDVLAINARRFQIEDYFKEMKSTISARPMFVSKDESIQGHTFICYLAVMVLMEIEARLAKKKIESTPARLREAIASMQVKEIPGLGYEPCHGGTESVRKIREAIEDEYGLGALEMEFISEKKMKEIRKALG